MYDRINKVKPRCRFRCLRCGGDFLSSQVFWFVDWIFTCPTAAISLDVLATHLGDSVHVAEVDATGPNHRA